MCIIHVDVFISLQNQGVGQKECVKKNENKLTGLDFPFEVSKCVGERGIVWQNKLFYIILKTRVSYEWREITLVPLYENKGQIQNWTNYRGIKLINYTEIVGENR